jgi:hypothetical protein
VHPQLAGFMKILCDGKEGREPIFILESFRKWLQKQKIQLARCNAHFVVLDLRKFAEQQGDIVGWNESNRAYILPTGFVVSSGVIIGIRCLSTCMMCI